MREPLIFDGHNDLLTRLLTLGGVSAVAGLAQGGEGAIDMPAARAGGFGGGFFAIWVPSPMDASARMAAMQGETYDMPLPDMVAQGAASRVVEEEFAILEELERQGMVRVCRTVADLRETLGSDRLAAICHIEGAEAIGPDSTELEGFYARGLRSLGPVWSRDTIFGHGVPFRFPSTGDIGPGLTDAGKRLVRECDRLGIMLDMSHLNEAGFRDVAAISTRPVVATHSNAHAVSPHARNLTDAQLDIIAESDGMVGLNFACAFLRPDGKMRSDVGVDVLLRHLDHLIDRLGEDRVGIGSDYDGALVPAELRTVGDLGVLRQAMADHGYDAPLMEKICHGNWLRVLKKSWA
ncbi:Membrane dipeptidase (Peptidase family M19) [Rhodobacteraceae bacterium THAF1]|uniref:dipeptidase n=1 Tax=Palleronia sp. THAF1 TaxID=2587842 RepID=UPI000F3F9879|nr:membrane dipeptidase [Palleronia sp. THAF1]QFU09494.1 Membrane dipeptidase (Peptidase family M19) [Palleronia sp. THAF1]VDC21825.1 Membrane dipeptidase (Peptidase family M19) [Rhodobacteraceae bacterium THAF1]